MKPARMGRISFLNVLPIYYPLEAGIIPHDFELVSGPPAYLNDMMAAGELQISSCSCFEYARRPERYYIARDLAIGSRGPVMSVLLLSRLPVDKLSGKEILISGESHTSAALIKLLAKDYYNIDAKFKVGKVTTTLRSANPPTAFLAIGDEALRLRDHPAYPYRVDLAEAWREWTGLPFIFGLWVIDSAAADSGFFNEDPSEILRAGRDWGLAHMDVILDLTSKGCPLSRETLREYYRKGLTYSLGEEELRGLGSFYEKLAACDMIPKAPELRFYNPK